MMKRPGSPSQKPRKKKKKHKMIQEQKLSDRFSRSLLANILDLDDFRSLRSVHNFRHASTRSASSCYSDCQSSHTTNSFRSSELHRSSTTSGGREHWDTTEASEHIHRKSTPVKVNYGISPRKSVAASLLEEILSELRLLTNKMKADDRTEDGCSDWKFAAMVIDRLCLCLFVIFTIISTFATLCSAPNFLA